MRATEVVRESPQQFETPTPNELGEEEGEKPVASPAEQAQSQQANPIELFLKRDNIYPKCTNIEIEDSMEQFYQIRKHFLIFSEAGKPIYSRYGDEMTLAPFFATMSAVIPKIQSYFWDPTKHASQN